MVKLSTLALRVAGTRSAVRTRRADEAGEAEAEEDDGLLAARVEAFVMKLARPIRKQIRKEDSKEDSKSALTKGLGSGCRTFRSSKVARAVSTFVG